MARTQLLLLIFTPLLVLAGILTFVWLQGAEKPSQRAWRYTTGPLFDTCPDPLPNGMVTFSCGPNIYWLRPDGSLHASLSRPELVGGFSWAAGPANLFFFSLDRRHFSSGAQTPAGPGPRLSEAVYLAAADPSGSIVWQLAVDGVQGISWISYGDENVFVPLPDGRILCAGLDGRLLWNIEAGARTEAQVVADDERGRFFHFTNSNELVARDMLGSELWRSRQIGAMNLEGPLVAADGSLRVVADGELIFSFDRDGKEQWHHRLKPEERIGGVLGGLLDGLRGQTPALSGRMPTYMNVEIAPDGSLCIGDYSGGVSCIDPAGKLSWRYQCRGDVMGLAISPDGTIYIASYGDGMHAVKPDGRRKWFDGTEKELVSAPRVGVDGQVYIEAFDALVAYKP